MTLREELVEMKRQMGEEHDARQKMIAAKNRGSGVVLGFIQSQPKKGKNIYTYPGKKRV